VLWHPLGGASERSGGGSFGIPSEDRSRWRSWSISKTVCQIKEPGILDGKLIEANLIRQRKSRRFGVG
jgi:hypothetical protein